MGGISIWQIIIILLVVVLVFGVGKLPAIGRDLGKALKEFRSSIGGDAPKQITKQKTTKKPKASNNTKRK